MKKKVVIHKRFSVLHAECGFFDRDRGNVVYPWKYVTCKNCLKKKPKEALAKLEAPK